MSMCVADQMESHIYNINSLTDLNFLFIVNEKVAKLSEALQLEDKMKGGMGI